MNWMRSVLRFLGELGVLYAYVGALYGSLFFAAAGQGVVLRGLVENPRQWTWIIMPPLMVPLLIVFFLTYLKVSPVPARAYCVLLLIAVTWYAAVTIVCELLLDLGGLSPDSPPHGRVIARVMMHAGWASFLPLWFLFRSAREFIQKSAS
jgi:hypothetical protein